ncbi:hypothetical protein [Bifidobacterium aerophilum]|uniref:Uncharacterized protein n=1 Tax=Bifidobacterium aerophilum TaxID=1798155 RepID=A0A6N9Z6A0_9BIFI|nr:hypothetical protein [Bifidobacterium aerophilum]NEG89645.1 hypothetical protein [Bifidobacterium aerophilum]
MQTRRQLFPPRETATRGRTVTVRKRRLTACLAGICTAALLASLSGCTTPRFAGRAESEQTLSDCEQAYYQASEQYDIASDAAQPTPLRYHAADVARSQWIEVAATCTDRFDEGTIRAAQADLIATVIAGPFGTTSDDSNASETTGTGDADAENNGTGDGTLTDDSPWDELDRIATGMLEPNALTGMALAEDRAGFAVEVLTARGAEDATLSMADTHKAIGERLMSLAESGTSGSLDDPRRKVYDVSKLIDAADATGTITDPATGLAATAYAVTEINCAREELTAIAGQSGDTGNAAGTTADNTGNDTAATTKSASATTAAETHTQSMRALARLIAAHAAAALSAGYPSFDQALFD